MLCPLPPFAQLLQHPWLTQGHTKAGNHELSLVKQSMRAYNARRKFRATIMSVQAMSALGRAMGGRVRNVAAAPGARTGKEGTPGAPNPRCVNHPRFYQAGVVILIDEQTTLMLRGRTDIWNSVASCLRSDRYCVGARTVLVLLGMPVALTLSTTIRVDHRARRTPVSHLSKTRNGCGNAQASGNILRFR